MDSEPAEIVQIDKLGTGVLVLFKDGSSTVFGHEFLHQNQHAGGIIPVQEPGGKPVGPLHS